MRTSLLLLLPFGLAFGQTPWTAYFVNAADGSQDIAAGSLIYVYAGPGAPSLPGDPQRVFVEFQTRGFGPAIRVPATVINSAQATAVVPPAIPLGTTTLRLAVDDQGSAPVSVEILAAAPALFVGQSGSALAQNLDGSGKPTLNQLTHPALPGQTVTLWATGLGPYTTADVTVEVAGESIHPGFAGHAPGQPGLDQINLTLPGDVFTGCYVPVTLHAGSRSSSAVTISTAAEDGACTHPLELSATQLAVLDKGGAITAGSINLTRSYQVSGEGVTRNEAAFADFHARSAGEIRLFSGLQQPEGLVFGCSLPRIGGVFGSLLTPTPNPAGPSLMFAGPEQQMLIAAVQGPFYNGAADPVSAPTADQLPPPFFTGGSWQVQAPGGSLIGRFQQTFTLPAPLQWTNRESLGTIHRNLDTAVTWDPQSYTSADVVQVQLAPVATSPFFSAVPQLSCLVHAQDGQVTLPHGLLQQLTTSTMALHLTLLPRNPADGLFAIPLASGGMVPAVLNYRFDTETIPVTLQD